MRRFHQTINPSNSEPLAQYPCVTLASAHAAAEVAAIGCAQHWSRTTLEERVARIEAIAGSLQERRRTLAYQMSLEMGKPLSQAIKELEKSESLCHQYAEYAPHWLIPPQQHATQTGVVHAPLGAILGVMPWNFPVWQLMRFAIPTLLAGNTVLICPSPTTVGTALMLQDVMREAGLPSDILQCLPMTIRTCQALIKSPHVAGLSLTGSSQTGAHLAGCAGRYLKKSVMELGGNDPYLILSDADLDLAARTCVEARMVNAGQVCIAPKRLIVDRSVYPDFLDAVTHALQSYVPGDPMDETTTLGPLARSDCRERVHQQVQRTVADGATCLQGGELPQGPGWFYPATLLGDVPPDSTLWSEEVFGPVVALTQADDANQAINLANQSHFGLGAAVFTQDEDWGYKLAAEHLEAGTVAVNSAVHSDPLLPFGGIKRSGYGRELGREGLLEFVNSKVITLPETSLGDTSEDASNTT